MLLNVCQLYSDFLIRFSTSLTLVCKTYSAKKCYSLCISFFFFFLKGQSWHLTRYKITNIFNPKPAFEVKIVSFSLEHYLLKNFSVKTITTVHLKTKQDHVNFNASDLLFQILQVQNLASFFSHQRFKVWFDVYFTIKIRSLELHCQKQLQFPEELSVARPNQYKILNFNLKVTLSPGQQTFTVVNNLFPRAPFSFGQH